MNSKLLLDLGLTQAQAKAYIALIERGEQAPPDLAKHIGESRSNTYMVLDKLAEHGLCEKVKKGKKLYYRANNPLSLESLAEKRRKRVAETEQTIKQAMPTLLGYYYSFTERPGVRLLQGLDGLKEIYLDTLRTRQPISLIRTPADVQHLGAEYIKSYIERRTKLGIEVTGLSARHPLANTDAELDKAQKYTRIWIEPKDYTAPVEVIVYGNKVAFAAFGEEMMGVVIDSPSIATAMRQIFQLSTRAGTPND